MSLLRSASIVSLLTLISRITGLFRELFTAYIFGASAMTDAFNVAFRIPNLFRRFFAEGAFSQAFVPTLAAAHAQHGQAHTKVLIDRVGTVLVWVLVLVCLAGILGAAGMVWLMASGLEQRGTSYDVAVSMTRWMFPYIGMMSLVAFSGGILNTWKRFAIPAATPILLNVSMVCAMWLAVPWFKRHQIEPIYALAVGVITGGLLQLLIQIPALLRLGLLPRIGWRWRDIRQAWSDAGTQHVIQLMMPALLGVGVAQISMLINTQIASYLTAGSVSWITYSDRFMEFPTALLGVALGVVLMPQLSKARAQNNDGLYSEMLDWGLRLIFIMSLPCAVALLCFAQPLITVLYHYGAFSPNDVRQTTYALQGWGVGLLGLTAIKVLAPGYYAQHDTRTPVRIAIYVLFLTQALNAALVPYLKHAALTLSIGIGALVNSGWLLLGLIRQGKLQPRPGWWRLILQTLAASTILALYLLWSSHAFDWIALGLTPFKRAGLLGAFVLGAMVLYFSVLRLCGLPLKATFRR